MNPVHQSLPLLLSITKIWDRGEHQGLTDLLQFKNKMWITFRQADTHYAGMDGFIRILSSANGVVWDLTTTLKLDGWDLRDPKLSIMPNGKLMLLAGASKYLSDKTRIDHCSLVAFSDDGEHFSSFYTLPLGDEWLWKLTWHQGVGYGVTYYWTNPQDRKAPWRTSLYQTLDGLNYEKITDFLIPGHPNETTIRFLLDGTMVALVRRDGKGERNAWIGTSVSPYEDWIWNETNYHIGGPDFIVFNDDDMIAGGRCLAITPYGWFAKTALWRMSTNSLYPLLFLPTSGDTSYPGLLYEAPFLWMSYYSSHEGKSCIYLAKFHLSHI